MHISGKLAVKFLECKHTNAKFSHNAACVWVVGGHRAEVHEVGQIPLSC